MKINLITVAFILVHVLVFSQNQSRNGKLLRGEKWQEFVPTEKADFYVATNGNDAWSGTLSAPNADQTDGPFATLYKAQEAVKELKQQVYKPKKEPVETRWIGSPHPLGSGRDILVYVREGYYSLDKPLAFQAEDGGERVETNLPTGAFEYHKLKDYYVTYAAYPGEKPVLSGGTRITGWKKNDKAWVRAVDDHTVEMLVCNGNLQTLARTPNKGYFTPPYVSKTSGELPFRPGDVQKWADMENNRVKMLLRWHGGNNSFDRIDEKNNIAYFKEPEEGVVIVPPRYYVENVKALLDAPGEWFYDVDTKELSYIPENGSADPNQLNIYSSRINNLISIKGKRGAPVRNLRLYGLGFEGALPGNQAISVEYAHACEIVGADMRACGGAGIYLKKGCYQTKILKNRFEKIENKVLVVDGGYKPAHADDILRETDIKYNEIYDCGGINIYAVNSLYTTISHNYITKTRGRYAIDVGRWQNLEEAIDGNYLVEYNHLDDVQKDADDSGAIKTTGLTFNSVVRRNLIHDVHAGFFNDNVAFWFDNMSSQWIAEENIYYNLEQGEMKLCAANLVDNIYRNNFLIDAPVNKPEKIIEGQPELSFDNLEIKMSQTTASGAAQSGSIIEASAEVSNSGSTGVTEVDLYLDGKVYSSKLIPSVHNNKSRITFQIRIYQAGTHKLAIGGTTYKEFNVEGNMPALVIEELEASHTRIPFGEPISLKGIAKSLTSEGGEQNIELFVNDQPVHKKQVHLSKDSETEVSFTLIPEVGEHSVRLGNSNEILISVYEPKNLPLTKKNLMTYCSPTADPSEIDVDPKKNVYRIKASGSDFFHAEDSYAAIYVDDIEGDFVATARITAFGERTHEWFRSGLFVRNDMTKSFDTEPGSKGSVLMFASTGRAGINYDEFGDGCMHKASSQNIPENIDIPIWIKLIRHGNSFTGYVSYDGENWEVERKTNELPGLNSAVDIGLAAGSCDKKQYWVEFSDFKIEIEK